MLAAIFLKFGLTLLFALYGLFFTFGRKKGLEALDFKRLRSGRFRLRRLAFGFPRRLRRLSRKLFGVCLALGQLFLHLLQLGRQGQDRHIIVLGRLNDNR